MIRCFTMGLLMLAVGQTVAVAADDNTSKDMAARVEVIPVLPPASIRLPTLRSIRRASRLTLMIQKLATTPFACFMASRMITLRSAPADLIFSVLSNEPKM
jgi:hypothetical protein